MQFYLSHSRPRKISCYNCGSNKHIGPECKELSMEEMTKSNNLFSPLIESYDFTLSNYSFFSAISFKLWWWYKWRRIMNVASSILYTQQSKCQVWNKMKTHLPACLLFGSLFHLTLWPFAFDKFGTLLFISIIRLVSCNNN